MPEALAAIVGRRSAGQNVHVLKVELSQGEILVADVAPAQDDGRAIGDELLVVHAAVDSREAGQQLTQPVQPRAVHVGLKMRISSFGCASSPATASSFFSNVPQSSSSRRTRTPRSAAAMRRSMMSEPVWSGVEDVVLEIEASGRRARSERTRYEGVQAGGEEPNPERPPFASHRGSIHRSSRVKSSEGSHRKRVTQGVTGVDFAYTGLATLYSWGETMSVKRRTAE